MVGGIVMNQLFNPSLRLRKKMLIWISIGEFIILLMLFKSFLETYHLIVSIILLIIVLAASVGFDIYFWNMMKERYIFIDDSILETNNMKIELEFVEEIRLRKEENKPMFLIFKVHGEYIKIPLRIYSESVEEIIKTIKEKGFKITE